jgi:hypothetical protein
VGVLVAGSGASPPPPSPAEPGDTSPAENAGEEAFGGWASVRGRREKVERGEGAAGSRAGRGREEEAVRARRRAQAARRFSIGSRVSSMVSSRARMARALRERRREGSQRSV